MAEFLTVNMGRFTGQTYLQLVPAPTQGVFVLPPGGLVVHNADNASRTFVIEVRNGDLVVPLFNSSIAAGAGFAWPFELRIPSYFDGVWGKLTATPTTQPSFMYGGRFEF